MTSQSSSDASPSPVLDADALDMLRAATATMREVPRLIKAVRSVYRSQNRRPQLEPAYVTAIERYVRFYSSKPLGLLDDTHLRAFLTHIARHPGMTGREQDLVHEALLFLHNEVLQQDLEPVTDFVRATSTSQGRSNQSFWSLGPAKRRPDPEE